MRDLGATVIVGLTHMFMNQDKKLAGCADFDLILGGHEHTLLQSSANGTPIFKMRADAREVGKFDLFIDKRTGKLESMDWEIIPVTDAIPDAPEFAPVAAKYKDLLEKLAVKVGANSVELDALSHSVRTKETNIGNFIADAYRKAADADVALVNGGSIRADLTYNPGPLTMRAVLSMLPFNNPIVKVEVTGKLLADILEHGVARSAEDNEPGRFPQVSGMSFKFDTRKLPGQRVSEIMVGGKPLDRKEDLHDGHLRLPRLSRRRRIHDVQGCEDIDPCRQGAEGFGSVRAGDQIGTELDDQPKTGRQDSADRVGLVFLGLCPPMCGKAPLFRDGHLETCGYAARLRYITRRNSREEETTISEKHSFSAHRAAEPGV